MNKCVYLISLFSVSDSHIIMVCLYRVEAWNYKSKSSSPIFGIGDMDISLDIVSNEQGVIEDNK